MKPLGIKEVGVLMCVVAVAPAAAVAQAPRDTVPPAVERHFALVRPLLSGDSARKTVAFMDQFFRLPGNSGFDASIARVVQILERAGYVLQDHATPASRLVYRIERRPMARPTWEPLGASITIAGDTAPLLRFATNRNLLAVNSYSTPGAGVEADIVYVGRATPEEFAGKNVQGKIVLGDASLGTLFRQAVQQRGAIGVLGFDMPAYLQPAINRGSIRFSSIPLDSAKRSWGMPISFAAREALLAALERGPVRVRVAASSRIYAAEERTLVADVRGARMPAERFVLSAHVQEPGANDNASGVATQVEMARVLGALVQRGAASPQRSITFIWGDEIVATRRYLAEDSVRALGVRWGMSLDMVGEDTRLTGGTFLIEKMPDPSAIWTRGADRHTEWGGREMRIDEMLPHYFNDFVLRRCLDQAAATGWIVRTNPYEGGSDHTPFIAAKKPGLLLWHFTDQFYHTDGDRLDKVSAQTMANVGAAALVSALTLTSADAATAVALVGEVERAAITRLEAEYALSRRAIAEGGERDREILILRTWTDWYRAALRSASDIEVAGPSASLSARLAAAIDRIAGAGAAHVSRLSGRAP